MVARRKEGGEGYPDLQEVCRSFPREPRRAKPFDTSHDGRTFLFDSSKGEQDVLCFTAAPTTTTFRGPHLATPPRDADSEWSSPTESLLSPTDRGAQPLIPLFTREPLTRPFKIAPPSGPKMIDGSGHAWSAGSTVKLSTGSPERKGEGRKRQRERSRILVYDEATEGEYGRRTLRWRG